MIAHIQAEVSRQPEECRGSRKTWDERITAATQKVIIEFEWFGES